MAKCKHNLNKKLLSLHKTVSLRVRSLKSAGFSLVELLIAVTILSLIVFAMTPLLLGSIRNIYYAGDKSEALYLGQSDMEVNIVEKTTVDGYEITLRFNDDEDGEPVVIEVAGGLLEVIKEHGSAETWLAGFIPYASSIIFDPNPYILTEGYDSIDLTLLGRDSQMTVGKAVTVYDRDNIEKSWFSTNLTEVENIAVGDGSTEYTQSAIFTLQDGLTNAMEPYTFELSWSIDEFDSIIVTVRARLRITMPTAVAVGKSSSVVVSSDGSSTWNSRANTLGGVDLNDVCYEFFNYIAVTSNGSVMKWTSQEEPYLQSITGISGTALNGLAFGNNVLVAVGNSGVIVTTINGETWVVRQSGKDYDFRAVEWNGNEFLAAGTKGTVQSSPDGIDWSEPYSVDQNLNLNGLAYGKGRWVLAGAYVAGDSAGKAVIYYQEDDGWVSSFNDSGNTAIFDIVYNPSNEIFVAVGKGGDGKKGFIANSTDGITFSQITDTKLPSTITNNNEFRKIYWYPTIDSEYVYIVLSNEGNIIVSEGKVNEESNWIQQYTANDSSKGLLGVAVQ